MCVKSLESLLHLVLPHISAQDMALLRTWADFGLLSVRSHFCGVRVKTASPILQSICAHVTTSEGLHWSAWNLILSGLLHLFTFPYFGWNLSTMLYTLYRYVHASSRVEIIGRGIPSHGIHMWGNPPWWHHTSIQGPDISSTHRTLDARKLQGH
jgi:hypothetical protein